MSRLFTTEETEGVLVDCRGLGSDEIYVAEDTKDSWVKSMIMFKEPKQYKLDVSKIKTLDDVVKVLDSLDINVFDSYDNFEVMKPYLKEVK